MSATLSEDAKALKAMVLNNPVSPKFKNILLIQCGFRFIYLFIYLCVNVFTNLFKGYFEARTVTVALFRQIETI